MSHFLLYFLLCTLSCNTVWVKGNSPPPPLVAVKPLPPPPPQVVVPPKWPFHVNFSTGVEGVVFCASCSKLSGFNKSIKAAPLHGAVVKLLCLERPLEDMVADDHPNWNSKKSVELEAQVETNKKGYFLIRVARIKPSLIRRCRVFVSPPKWCSRPILPPTNKQAGIIPKFEKVIHFGNEEISLYTTGFFEFEPVKIKLCPH